MYESVLSILVIKSLLLYKSTSYNRVIFFYVKICTENNVGDTFLYRSVADKYSSLRKKTKLLFQLDRSKFIFIAIHHHAHKTDKDSQNSIGVRETIKNNAGKSFDS